MNRRGFLVLALTATLTGPALAAGETPTQLVEALYRQQAANDKNPKTPGPDSKRHRAKFFSKALVRLLEADSKLADKEGQGKLDFSPYYDGQDFEISELKVGEARITGDKAELVARFKNFGKLTEITYELVQENGQWRISNIRGDKSDPKWDLVSYITRKD